MRLFGYRFAAWPKGHQLSEKLDSRELFEGYIMELVRNESVMALRCLFHFENGKTDKQKAANHLDVNVETIEQFLKEGYVPEWMIGRLMIH